MRKTTILLTLFVLMSIYMPFAAGQQEEVRWHEPIPFLGPQPTLVLLVDFSDVKMRISTSQAAQLVKIVDDFVRSSSYGKTWLEYYIHPKVITLPKQMSYYGGPSSGAQRGDDKNRILEYHLTTIKYAKERERIDLSRFKHVILIHAGKDEAVGGTANDIWSHCNCVAPRILYKLIEQFGFDAVEQDLRRQNYDWVVELFMHRGKDGKGNLLAGIMTVAEEDYPAVLAHEFTHSMWISDHYVYAEDGYSAGSEVGVWTNMDAGPFLNPPVDIDGWSKYLIGWIEVIEVQQSGEYVIHTLDKPDEPHALLIKINQKEYYFIHARRPVKNDAALPGPGILIFRVNEYVDRNIEDKEYFIRLMDANPATPAVCANLPRQSIRLCEGVDAPFIQPTFRNTWRHNLRLPNPLSLTFENYEFTTEEGFVIRVTRFDTAAGIARIFVDLGGKPSETTVDDDDQPTETTRTVTRTVTGTVAQTVYTTQTIVGERTQTIVVTVTVRPPPPATPIEEYISLVIVLAALLVAFGLIVSRRRAVPGYPPPPPPPPQY
ncbi:MAG: hypothetical protein QXG21_04320 [Candidatus Caldarchaeum sp.]